MNHCAYERQSKPRNIEVKGLYGRWDVQLHATVDGGGWVTGMTWRKAVILEAGERASVLALRDLLNRSKPAMDDLGYMLWDRCYGMCNRQCWQWELVSAHSTCVNEILRKAGIDWPVDGIPSIDKPIITINLAIN